MREKFKISYRKSCGNLHVYAEGTFNGMCAWVLIKTIKNNYSGYGRVFIETAFLIELLPDGVDIFKKYMPSQMTQINNLYIKGKKGFKIGPNGCRVLICKPHKKSIRLTGTLSRV